LGQGISGNIRANGRHDPHQTGRRHDRIRDQTQHHKITLDKRAPSRHVNACATHHKSLRRLSGGRGSFLLFDARKDRAPKPGFTILFASRETSVREVSDAARVRRFCLVIAQNPTAAAEALQSGVNNSMKALVRAATSLQPLG